MTGPLQFPDIQKVLVTGLQELAGGDTHTGTQTPADWAGALPFIRVLRTGGPSGVNSDHPHVDIDVFAATYDQAAGLAEEVRQFLVGPPPALAIIDRARCEIGPRELPWADNGTVRKITASYHLTTRRYRAS